MEIFLPMSQKFSSPIGAFIFLIEKYSIFYWEPSERVFVPYRGFYFLNLPIEDLDTTEAIDGFRPLSGLLFS